MRLCSDSFVCYNKSMTTHNSKTIFDTLYGRITRTRATRQKRLTLTVSQLSRIVDCAEKTPNLGEDLKELCTSINKRVVHYTEIKMRHVSVTLRQAEALLALLQPSEQV